MSSWERIVQLKARRTKIKESFLSTGKANCTKHKEHTNWVQAGKDYVCGICQQRMDNWFKGNNFKYNFNREDYTKPAIYCITNLTNRHKYIGSAGQLNTRIFGHRNALNINKHHNAYLQRAFNKYGITNFEVSILELCRVEELGKKELYWYTLLKPEYNVTPVSANRGPLHTEETRAKMSKTSLKNRGVSEVHMIDRETDELIAVFSSNFEASMFIIYANLSKSKSLDTIKNRLSHVARGNEVHTKKDGSVTIQDHLYGFKWRYA